MHEGRVEVPYLGIRAVTAFRGMLAAQDQLLIEARPAIEQASLRARPMATKRATWPPLGRACYSSVIGQLLVYAKAQASRRIEVVHAGPI